MTDMVAELKSALKAANAQTEEFERKWYLCCDTIEQLKGQQSVLVDLLRECLSVLVTIDEDDCHEVECLSELEIKCEEAIEGAITGGMAAKPQSTPPPQSGKANWKVLQEDDGEI